MRETELAYLISIPCYFRDPKDRSKILERPDYARCWAPKKDCQLIDNEDDLAEEVQPDTLHDLGNEYDGAYPDYEPELSEVDETPEVSDSHLKFCPECGKDSFDLETGICIKCGFN
jgi:hypothetical protein